MILTLPCSHAVLESLARIFSPGFPSLSSRCRVETFSCVLEPTPPLKLAAFAATHPAAATPAPWITLLTVLGAAPPSPALYKMANVLPVATSPLPACAPAAVICQSPLRVRSRQSPAKVKSRLRVRQLRPVQRHRHLYRRLGRLIHRP
ncbi:hypothetical protein BR93DRAFT_605113 [Coniochaeta sp. PMI_546]|nr:hypothetical protein BR93DRAFT_605113 [Coniochaeta sp. PMI_546]